MKQIPIQLDGALQKHGRSTAFLVKVLDDEGDLHGFTNLDKRIEFDDGEGSTVYSPRMELYPQNIQNTSDMDVDNTELHGWFDEVMEAKVLAGKLANAQITIYRVQYLKLHYGAEVVAYGMAGKIDYTPEKSGKRKLEWRSFTDLLKSKRNDLYSTTCRNQFGDDKCGMPFIWHSATISSVEDNRTRFYVSGLSEPDHHFSLGVVEFLGGPNAGATIEVEDWRADGRVVLTFPTPFAVTDALNVRFRQDCPKTALACIDYGNIVNMNAEHLTPTQDQSLMVPGAYIKSANAL